MVEKDKKRELEESQNSEDVAGANSSEDEKVEIEDMLGEDELDIDDAVSEEKEGAHPVIEETDEKVKEAVDETADIGQKDALEKAIEETEEEKPTKNKKVRKRAGKKWLKIAGLIALTILITTAVVLGIIYYLNEQKKTGEEPAQEDVVIEEEPEDVVENSYAYISSEVGLNMREEPNTDAKVIAIIPYGTKIEVLSETAGWTETEYQNEKGWVSTEYTTKTDPTVYENETYGFGLTFKPSWAGYKFFEAKNTGSTTAVTYYVALPTTDTSWSEPGGVPAGYASLFVMGVYTKAEWAKLEGEEMKPAKLGESDKYVYTYLPGQAHPKDLPSQYNEIKDIIGAFEVLK